MNSFTSIFPLVFSHLINILKHDSARKRLKKLNNLKSAYNTFENPETDFEKSFIEPVKIETCFFIETGIETNFKSIPKYIAFKDKLGLNFTWSHIKKIQNYLDLTKGEISLTLSRSNKIYSNIILVTILIILTSGFLSFLFLNQYKVKISVEYFLVFLPLAVSFLLAYILFSSIDSILTAKLVEKRLNKIESL